MGERGKRKGKGNEKKRKRGGGSKEMEDGEGDNWIYGYEVRDGRFVVGLCFYL